MTSYFNLLKYAATGIASPDMTYFDKMRASTLMGGAVKTLTGIPPLSFKSDGSPLISWSMKGNGSQQGTPTPDNPVMPEFVGVRTGNLFDKTNSSNMLTAYIDGTGKIISNAANTCIIIAVEPNTTYTVSASVKATNGCRIAEYQTKPAADSVGTVKATLNAGDDYKFTITTANSTNYIAFHKGTIGASDRPEFVKAVMVNEGSTALPYEPFGYKIPLTCAGQTVPVYLGEVPTVRRVRKLVLTSTTAEWTYDSTYNRYTFRIADSLVAGVRLTPVACSHFVPISDGRSIGDVPNNAIYSNLQQATNNWFIKTTDYTTTSSFKQFLDDELAAGTPVTVWYVLATPQTAIVNEPLAKIGDYADELSSTDAAVTIPTVKGQNVLTVDTPIQPSEMTITFKG